MNQNNVVGILELAQTAGLFQSQSEELLALIAKQGQTSAQVEQWEKEQHLRVFAGCVQSVVTSLLSVAKKDLTLDPRDARLQLVDGRKADDVPVGSCIKRSQPLVVMLNSGQSKADGRDAVQRIWAPFGSLQMRALVLEIGEAQEDGSAQPTASVTLYMGMRDVPDDFVEGFSYFTFNTVGKTSAHARFTRKPRIGRRLYEQLGLRELKDVVPSMDGDGGTAEQMLGFPGAFQYLAQAMPLLPGYLQNFAAE